MLAQSDPGRQPGFTMGDGQHIRSEHCLRISVELSDPASAPSRVTRQGEDFTCCISRDIARRFQELVRGLKISSNPGRQYLLEDDDPHSPVRVLSRGEYDENT